MSKMKKQLRFGHALKDDKGFVDINAEPYYGKWFDNQEFECLDSNGDEDLEQSCRRVCHRLNILYPHLNHWVGTRYVEV